MGQIKGDPKIVLKKLKEVTEEVLKIKDGVSGNKNKFKSMWFRNQYHFWKDIPWHATRSGILATGRFLQE